MPKKIFVIEDDKILCTITVMFLSDLGYELIGTSQDGLLAIEKCKALPVLPDLFLMDIHISGHLNGIETSSLIKAKFDTPVLYISSDSEILTIRNLLQTNFFGYLVKPYDKKLLSFAIALADIKIEHNKIITQQGNQKVIDLLNSPDGSILISKQLGWIIDVNGITFNTPDDESTLFISGENIISENFIDIFNQKISTALSENTPIDYFECELTDINGNKHNCALMGYILSYQNHKAAHIQIKKL